MPGGRHIIKQAAVAAVAVAVALGAPAVASAGGIDATKSCVEYAAKQFDPTSPTGLRQLSDRLKLCGYSAVSHFADTQKRDQWYDCVMTGIARSVPPLGWEPAIYGLVSCSQTWLDFHPEIDLPGLL